MRAIVALALCGTLGACAATPQAPHAAASLHQTQAHAHANADGRAQMDHQNHAHHEHSVATPLPAGSHLDAACRQGAFLEASSILNSVIEISFALSADVPEHTRRELDSILYTALKQARTEVHCVQGGLGHGYHEDFAQIIERSGQLASLRGLSPDVVTLADETARALRDHGAAR